MAFVDDALGGALGGWGGGLLVGLGAALVAPAILPGAGSAFRPVAKTLVKGVLLVADGVKGVLAEATEQVGDLVAEVREESTTTGDGTGARKHRSAASHA